MQVHRYIIFSVLQHSVLEKKKNPILCSQQMEAIKNKHLKKRISLAWMSICEMVLPRSRVFPQQQ
jgi:hypothetical protein